ncbi:hypothetical protein ABDK56_06365 [Sphingomonas sp. ASV193]|uniref:hypothetical protein n=1 Tax=Sphingomonas sp. ASV193 TaxID=3144405 RepID=UPI0032E8F014
MNSKTLQFYLDRADEARRQGDAATLSHVKERCRRSQAAWTQLADQVERAEHGREQQERHKAAQQSK